MAAHFDVVIIGASFSGIWNLHLLRQQGYRVLLLDQQDDVGGSWQMHHYPGCVVDAEQPYYEFSDPQLWQKWDWSARFASQREIQRYLAFVCDTFELRPCLRFRTRVTAAHWTDIDRRWCLFEDQEQLAVCRYLVSCTGYATEPLVPDLPGLTDFPTVIHTSRWPHRLDYQGKRVGIIGTGSTGVQCIEEMAADVKSLVVFQRSPNLATPRRQEVLTAEKSQELKQSYSAKFIQRRSRNGYAVTHTSKTFDHSPAERLSFWEDKWRKGGSSFWRDNYIDLLVDATANDAAYEFWCRATRRRIHDPRVASILAPLQPPYAFGTRRPALETNYFEAFNESHVHLVDLNVEPIMAIGSDAVHTAQACYHVDILILATGFDFVTGAMLAMDIRGADGKMLADSWHVDTGDKVISTYLGLMTRGFPNLFFPMGPQAPTALAYTPYMAEVQGAWISKCLCHMRETGSEVIEPTEAAELWWTNEVFRVSDATLFHRTKSWYMGQNIAHRQKQPLCYMGDIDGYVGHLEQSIQDDFSGFCFA